MTTISIRRLALVPALALSLTVFAAAPAGAHPHAVDQDGNGVWTDANGNGTWDPGEEPQLANGTLHGAFTLNDDGFAETSGGGPAAYGIETAHHGPDSGRPGKADGKYQTDATAISGPSGPGSDDNNPAIQ